MSKPVLDSAQREAALDISRSFCVQAPAGSGKTELLTQRLLNLLAHVQQPEEILAFTFTRKAAAEMRERLLHSLKQARARAALPDFDLATLAVHQQRTHALASAVLKQDSSLGWGLLENPQRLRLNTIDSFTSWLTAQLPLSASLGARASITTEMKPVFQIAIHSLIARLDETSSVGEALRTLLPHLQNKLQTVESLLISLLYKREQWLEFAFKLNQAPGQAQQLMEETLAELVDLQLLELQEHLEPYADELLELLHFATLHLQDQPEHELHLLASTAMLPEPDSGQLAQWQSLCRFFLVKSLESFRKRLTAKEGFPAKKDAKDKAQEADFNAKKAAFAELAAQLELAGILPMLQLVPRLPEPRYTGSQWQILSALATLLPVLAAELNVAMQQAGQVDHTETSLAALRSLGTEAAPTDLALKLDYRVNHILVDEFQDTSSLQFHLIEKLILGWTPGDGRTLFVVGDGMQSCYAFRNAKVSLFLKARDEGIGTIELEPLELQVNFRSDNSVVSWVNSVFSQAFPQLDDLARGGVRYSPSAAQRDDALTPGVHCHFWIDQPDLRSELVARREHEADEIAALCARLQQEDAAQSIAVLVRSRSHLRELVPALRKRGLRWNASKIDSLLSYPALQDLLTLLKCHLSLADHTAWYALLRCPMIGLSLEDLLTLAQSSQEQEQSLWSTLQNLPEVDGLSDDARLRLARALPALQHARQLRHHYPLRELLEDLWLSLGGSACLEDPAMHTNIASFFALVDQQTVHGEIPDLGLFEEKLKSAYGSAVDASVTLELMTIHNAKGLEFDVVLIPGLDRTPRSNDRELMLWQEHLDQDNQSRPILALMPEKGEPADPLYDYLQYEHKQRDALEATRLLYIAVTRAAKSAWLFGYLQGEPGGFKTSSTALLQGILPALLAAPDTLNVAFATLNLPPQSTAQFLASPLLEQPLLRLPQAWEPPSVNAVFPRLPEPVEVEPVHDQLLLRTIGELVHLALKYVVERGKDWLPTLHTSAYWRQQLIPLCQSEQAVAEALAKVEQHVNNCLQQPSLAWLFNGSVTQDACELALVDYSSGFRRDYIIDRTFIDNDGCRWIIDYKSAAPAQGITIEHFLEQQQAQYAQQLQGYGRLFQVEGRPLKLALLFTALPLLQTLD